MTIYIVGILLTLYHPIYGIFLYFFEWHNHPPYWWWGKNLPDPRWSFLIAVVIVVSLIINRKKLAEFAKFQYKPLVWLILIVVNSYLVSTLFAIDQSGSYEGSEVLLKLAINYFLMIYIIRNPRDYRVLIFIILVGVANFGRVAWEQGSNRDLGIAAPGATSGNLIAAYIMSIVPFYGIAFLNGKKWMKIFVVISLPFVLNAIILENSRGTVVGLASIVALMPFFVKGKTRFRVIGAMLLAAVLFLRLTDQQFWERQETTTTYEEDNSAMSRIYLWKGGFKFMKDYPFGGGANGFESISHEYVPELRERMLEHHDKTVHNTFLNVGTHWGFLGLFLYLGWLIHTFLILRRIRKDAKKTADYNFYNLQAIGIILALSGALIAGLFSNRQYAENVFWFSAFAVALRNMQLRTLREYKDFGKNIKEAEFESDVEDKLQLTHN